MSFDFLEFIQSNNICTRKRKLPNQPILKEAIPTPTLERIPTNSMRKFILLTVALFSCTSAVLA